MGPISGSSPLNEPGEHVWVQCADSREAAVTALKVELGLAPNTASEDLSQGR